MTVSVISVDPAPSKTSTVCKGTPFEDGKHFCEKTPKKLRDLLNGVDPNTLVCWDAPLTGPQYPDRAGGTDRDFSQRRIDGFFSRGATGFKTPPGISVLPYSSCPHWAITRSLLGLPRTGSWDRGYGELPFRLLPGSDEGRDPRPSVVEIHPAVAAWLWCRRAETQIKRAPVTSGRVPFVAQTAARSQSAERFRYEENRRRRRNQMIRLGGRLAVVVEPEAGADLGVPLLGGNCARSARDRAAGR